MYAFIKGTFVENEDDNVVVEANGIGYNIKMPSSAFNMLPPKGSEIKVYTYTSVREDAIWLYGFLTRDDLKLFKLLITVSGIGPKGALGVLSGLSSENIRFAIISGDSKALSKCPGIGAKSAQRIILELKDKIAGAEVEAALTEGSAVTSMPKGNMNDAIEALTALGYSRTEASHVVSISGTEDMSVEDILKAALKHISF